MAPAKAQSLGNAADHQGSVTDQSGASVPGANGDTAECKAWLQPICDQRHGWFVPLTNIPPNPHHLQISAPGFNTSEQDVTVRNAIPVQVKTVGRFRRRRSHRGSGGSGYSPENDPSAHCRRGPKFGYPNSRRATRGLSQAITYATGGVAADANGFFHPLGDHSQTSFIVDGQPISDQQSKVFSTQLPISAIQSMEIVTGTPDAEFGDKSSLVAQITTRSGLGAGRVFGNVDAQLRGPSATPAVVSALGFGSAKFGNFLAVDGVRSGRFLDTPEFTPFHDKGNSETIFDRFDYQPNGQNVFHLNLFAARNWIQIPNTYDQLAQDQRQRVLTWSIAPGYQHTSAHTFAHRQSVSSGKDQVNYYPSRDPFDDTPAPQNQTRQLLNWGVKSGCLPSAATTGNIGLT